MIEPSPVRTRTGRPPEPSRPRTLFRVIVPVLVTLTPFRWTLPSPVWASRFGVEVVGDLKGDGAVAARDVPVGLGRAARPRLDGNASVARPRAHGGQLAGHPDPAIPRRGFHGTVHAVEVDTPSLVDAETLPELLLA